MDNFTALFFLPQDQINLVHSHETSEMNRYRWLALRYLPFDTPMSRLMTIIGQECVHRLLNLQEVASRMELGACIDVRSLPVTSYFDNNYQHFFVVDARMARQVLIEAVEAAKSTCTFISWLLETNATPELHQPLFIFSIQKNNEHRILQDYLDQ
jgi:hypothetical protein|tara:strand:- start:1652 stop:2116 length:465 start_codon:yes stop_codon:yes gene_type:complete